MQYQKIRLIISFVVCFLLGAAPVLAGIYFDWDAIDIFFALVGSSVASASVVAFINKPTKKEEQETRNEMQHL